MPLIVLDPSFSRLSAWVAFVAPLAIGMVAKDVLEPLLIGHSTSLTPVRGAPCPPPYMATTSSYGNHPKDALEPLLIGHSTSLTPVRACYL